MTNPIALIPTQSLMRHALIGARADDPVLPESPRRPRRRRLFRKPDEQVHFHLGPDMRPFVCEARHCDSPGVTLTPAHRSA